MTEFDRQTDPVINGKTFEFYSPYDKLHLVGRNWPVLQGRTRAVILIIHGSGEHCQRYTHMAQFYNTRHFACVSFDLRGHGLSDGERGYIPKLDALLADFEEIISYIRKKLYPNIPLILYSHGTGSLFCLAHCLRRPNKPLDCQAMIISTPSLCLNSRPSSLLLFFSRAFANLSPHFRLPIEGNYTNLYTSDQEVVKAYRNDQLVHDRWPATTITIMLEIGVLLERTVLQVHCPTLIQHGENDTITPINGIRKWVQCRTKGDVTFKAWPEHLHELQNDIGKENIFFHSILWIEKKLNI